MIGKLVSRTLASAAFAVGIAGSAFGASATVASVEALNPNPNNLTMVDAASNTIGPNGITLAAFQGLMTGPTGAYRTNTGGVLDFQQQFQGGSWPNASSSSNGVDVGNGPAFPVTATYGISNASSIQFYRLPNGAVQDAIDSNTNQGTNVVSGGGMTQNGGGTAIVDFTTTPGSPTFVATSPPGTAGVGGGYMGVTGSLDIELQFVNGLAAFGITALPRGATRTTQLRFTLSDNSTFSTSTEVVGGSAVFFGGQLTPAQLASGLSISRVALIHSAASGGVNRYDDLAFIVAPAIPEPSSAVLLGLGLVGVIRKRRQR